MSLLSALSDWWNYGLVPSIGLGPVAGPVLVPEGGAIRPPDLTKRAAGAAVGVALGLGGVKVATAAGAAIGRVGTNPAVRAGVRYLAPTAIVSKGTRMLITEIKSARRRRASAKRAETKAKLREETRAAKAAAKAAEKRARAAEKAGGAIARSRTRKGTKKRTGRRGPRKMTAKQLKYFGKGRKRQ